MCCKGYYIVKYFLQTGCNLLVYYHGYERYNSMYFNWFLWACDSIKGFITFVSVLFIIIIIGLNFIV